MIISARNQFLTLYQLTDVTGADHFPKAQLTQVGQFWGRITTPSGREIALAEATEQKLDAVIAIMKDDFAKLTGSPPRGAVYDPEAGAFYRLGYALSQRQHDMIKLMASLIQQDQDYVVVTP